MLGLATTANSTWGDAPTNLDLRLALGHDPKTPRSLAIFRRADDDLGAAEPDADARPRHYGQLHLGRRPTNLDLRLAPGHDPKTPRSLAHHPHGRRRPWR